MYDPARDLGCHDTDECQGGYRRVSAGYVDEHCPRIGPPVDEPMTPEEQALNDAVLAHNRQRRSALANTSYPCPVCNPEQYLRWVDGDWPKLRPVSARPAPVDEPVRVGPPERADID